MEEKSFWKRLKEAFIPPKTSGTASKDTGKPNLWGLSGRQTQMQNRILMQYKVFFKPPSRFAP